MSRQQPIQSYYPSARVRLIVRFEDYGDSSTPEPPKTPPQQRKGKKDSDGKLTVERDENGALRLVGPSTGNSNTDNPQMQQTSSDSYTHCIDGIIPITASWSQNGIRTADTLNLELEFADFPLDPLVIRSCAVEFFLGTVSAEDFQRGLSGEMRLQSNGFSTRYNVIPDDYTDEQGRTRTNRRFQGWVDSWDAEWPEGGSPKVVIECTDNTRLLIEQQHPSRLALSVDEPLDVAVANYLSNFPQFQGLSVLYMPKGNDAPTIKTSLSKQAYPPGVGPSAAKNGDSKLSVWDYLTDVVRSVGLNIRIDGTTILLQRPRSIYNNKFPSRTEDPFQGRTIPRLGDIGNRLFIYGQNILSMKWHREFTKYAPLNVEVRSYNPRRKKTLIARFPRTDKGNKRLMPGDNADQKYEVISIPGIQDEAVLRAIAQQLYEVLGRNEILVNVLTKNLGSYGGGNLDPDFLDAKVGDAVDIVVQRSDLNVDDQNTVNTVQGQLASRPQEFLESLGFPTEFAKAYARAVNNRNYQSTFRLREIHIDWDKSSDGIRIDFDAVNYIEVRADAELPEGEEETIADSKSNKPPIVVKDDVGS